MLRCPQQFQTSGRLATIKYTHEKRVNRRAGRTMFLKSRRTANGKQAFFSIIFCSSILRCLANSFTTWQRNAVKCFITSTHRRAPAHTITTDGPLLGALLFRFWIRFFHSGKDAIYDFEPPPPRETQAIDQCPAAARHRTGEKQRGGGGRQCNTRCGHGIVGGLDRIGGNIPTTHAIRKIVKRNGPMGMLSGEAIRFS